MSSGLIAPLLGLLHQIGQRGDSADATGSLHAKVGDLKNFTGSFLNSPQKPRGAPVIGVGRHRIRVLFDAFKYHR